ADEPRQGDPGEEGGQCEGARGRIGIVEEPLGEINAESAGVLDGASGGLGTDLWRGLGRDRLTGLIVQLPAHPKSAALRDLARRALLSRAVTPAGAAAGRSLVALRMERLLAMGDLPGVRALAQAVPPRAQGNGLGAVEVEGLFLAGDNEAACSAARRHLEASDAPGLQIALVACQAIAGEHDKASLGLALLREQDARVPPTFVDLLQVLSGTL